MVKADKNTSCKDHKNYKVGVSGTVTRDQGSQGYQGHQARKHKEIQSYRNTRKYKEHRKYRAHREFTSLKEVKVTRPRCFQKSPGTKRQKRPKR